MRGEEAVEVEDEAVLARRREEHVLLALAVLGERLGDSGCRAPLGLLVEAADHEVELAVFERMDELGLAPGAPQHARAEFRCEAADEVGLGPLGLPARRARPRRIVADSDPKLAVGRQSLAGPVRVAWQAAGKGQR